MSCLARAVLAAPLCLAAFIVPSAAIQMASAPVPKVIAMLNDMKAKGIQMMTAEKTAFAAYSKWVDARRRDLGYEISTAERRVEALVASIDKSDSDANEFSTAVAKLDAEIARLEGEKRDATTMREAEHAEFVKLEADYSESVDALERAIQVLSAQAYSRPQAEALLQKMAKTTPGMGRVLAALVQQGEPDITGAPAVAAYNFQSAGVVEILEKLLAKFRTELNDAITAESNKDHHYQLEVLHLANTIARSTADRDEKIAAKAQAAAASAQSKGELSDTRSTLAEDKSFLSDMNALFKTKSATFEANQQVREDELTAIAKAVEILSSPAVSESYAEHVKLAQLPAPALLQTKSRNGHLVAQQRATELLQRRASELSSRTLAGVAAEVSSNPFAKVIDMVENLLARLREEAASEATHKEWCDGELKANKIKRDKKTAAADRLAATVEQLDASIAAMAADIAELQKEQAELASSIAVATEQRTAEKSRNEKTIADAKAGSAAVKQALVILKEFYASTAALLQAGDKRQVPELEEYKGLQGESTGVVGMLEVIQSDFARLLADTDAAEAQAAREYDAFMHDAEADKQQKRKVEVKTSLRMDQAEFDRSQTNKDLKAVKEELDGAEKYYEVLKPSCVQVNVSYEERVARRKEEIEALKQAYAILNGNAAA